MFINVSLKDVIFTKTFPLFKEFIFIQNERRKEDFQETFAYSVVNIIVDCSAVFAVVYVQ